MVETHHAIKAQRNSDQQQNAQNQQQVFQQYVNLATKISEQTPLVILLDDMHWADTSSTNLLFYLSRQITTKRILVIATYRPDEAAAGNKGKGHPVLKIKNEILRYETGKAISLGYLDESAIHELLMKTFGEYKHNTSLEQWLRKISDGNSLFITQFVKTLREDGLLNERGVFTGKYEEVTVPISVMAVIEERTRRLDKNLRELLRYATAEGEEFTSYILARLTQKPPLELLQELKKAEHTEVVHCKGSARLYANQITMIYGYSHALFHKALYDSLYEQEKEILHKECYKILKGEWDRLTETKERTMPLATKLLVHAEKSGELADAAEIAITTAHGAWQTYAESEALEMINQAKRLAGRKEFFLLKRKRDEILGDALLLQSRINTLRGRYETALRETGEAFEYFQRSANDIYSATVLNQRARIMDLQGVFHESEIEARKALAIARTTGDRRNESSALTNIGIVYNNLGAYDKALEFYKQSLEIKETLGDRAGIASALNSIGLVHNYLGEYNEALEFYMQSLEIAEKIDNRELVALLLNNIGLVYFSIRVFDKALEYFNKSLKLCESIGDRHGVAGALGNIGLVHNNLNAYDDALAFYEQSLKIVEEIGDRRMHTYALYGIGNIYIRQSLYDKALPYLEKSLTLSEKIHGKLEFLSSLILLGEVQRNLGNIEKSASSLARALELSREIHSHLQEAQVLYYWGLLLESESAALIGITRSAKLQKAINYLEESKAIFLELKIIKDAEEVGKELERIKMLLER
ncbi:MAG TPA: tetratricopeptide repeat protein [Candidatus Kapabacteria bacterium]|nr:tetratricopeptide repeat protein [Candidatus Kapabacteria bacterium]